MKKFYCILTLWFVLAFSGVAWAICEVYDCDIAWRVGGSGYLQLPPNGTQVVIKDSTTLQVVASPTPDAYGNYCWRVLQSGYYDRTFLGVVRPHEYIPIGPTACPTP